MQKNVSLFPLTQGITMMKNTFIGADTGSMLLPVCVMLGLTALCTVLSIRFFRWEEAIITKTPAAFRSRRLVIFRLKAAQVRH